ncbi:hypothetical protein C8Q79DRAFT_1120565 [Trametes meyenii]|nr:hypothetical protein C8Q79DRAFT_1120565 [Trametes meyenii]
MSNHTSASTTPDPAIPPRAPSRAGYRRPPLTRTISSRNVFPDLPPISTIKTRSCSDSDSDSDHEDELLKPLALALPPLCPPSPVSPTSTASSSSLYSPTSSSEDLDDYEDEPGCDGFPPPPLPQSSYLPPPPQHPPTPVPTLVDDDDDEDETDPNGRPRRRLFHNGLSRSAFAAAREFWDRRYFLWHTWRNHVDHLDDIQATYAQDGLRATLRYPPSPALPRTRDVPGQSTNGRVPGEQSTRAWFERYRLQTYSPYAPIFPRVGDLGALRDPGCDWFDRTFIAYPTYSIQKRLFLHDALAREGERRRRLATVTSSPLTRGTDSPASAYSEDAADTPRPDAASLATDVYDDTPHKPWEHDWRARWQVLFHRPPLPSGPPYAYPSATQPTPVHACASVPGHANLSTLPSVPNSGSEWASSAFIPPPQENISAEDEDRPFVWQVADDVPDLVPLDSPLTRIELEGAPVPGVPLVRLPTPAATMMSGSGEGGTRSLADELARIVEDAEERGEGWHAEEDIAGVIPPRPASPASRFFLCGGEDEDGDEEDDVGEFAVRVRPRPVSC